MPAFAELRQPSQLEINRSTGVARLRNYLYTPSEFALFQAEGRTHQGPSMFKLLQFWEKGETAGYFGLPPGTGKTVIAAGIIRATQFNTIITSPTGTISEKTKETIEDIAGVRVTNFDQYSKSLEGTVVNTTPNSLDRVAAIPGVREATQLVIIDENDLGTISAQRYKLWRMFPNALIVGLTATPDFSQLQELFRKGLVDPSERWVGAFSKKIDSMTRMEAMEQGALTPLDVELIRTQQVVGDVHISAGGRYNETQITRFLSTQARNAYVVSLIAGLGALPQDIHIPGQLQSEIQRIHEKIAGKRTIVFGSSIAHIDEMAEQLRAQGVVAVSVNGEMPQSRVDDINRAHKLGLVPVVLTAKLWRRGWDSPPTEVGLFADASQNRTDVDQGVGRFHRLSPETDKAEAIAVQLVDDYAVPGQRPVLIPQLFDPDDVHRGTKTIIDVSTRTRRTQEPEASPLLRVSGLGIEALVEEITSEELLYKRFEGLNVAGINEFFDEAINGLKHKQHMPLQWFYQQLAALVPEKMNHTVQQMVLRETRDIDGEEPKPQETKDNARRAFILMNLRGILSIIGHHFTDDIAHNEDVIQEALSVVSGEMDTININENVQNQLRVLLNRGAFPLTVAADEGVSAELVRAYKDGSVLRTIDRAIATMDGLDADGIALVAGILSESTRIDVERLIPVIAERNERYRDTDPGDRLTGDSAEEVLLHEMDLAEVRATVEKLSEREADIIWSRKGQEEAETLEAIGARYGVTRETIRGNEAKALAKLRRRLRDTR